MNDNYIKAIAYNALRQITLYISVTVLTLADWLGFFDNAREQAYDNG